MARGSAAGEVRINLVRVMDLLQEHISSALCQATFRRVRTTERQRKWTLHALVSFWTAVILRAPPALSQALLDSLEGREPLVPRIQATPEAVTVQAVTDAVGRSDGADCPCIEASHVAVT